MRILYWIDENKRGDGCMTRLRKWLEGTSTHKIVTTLVYIGCGAFIIVVLVGWFCGLENAVGMMNCAAMVIVANTVQYAGKSGFEHSKWATPLATGIAAGLSSGDPVSGIQNAAQTYESMKQMQEMADPVLPEENQLAGNPPAENNTAG